MKLLFNLMIRFGILMIIPASLFAQRQMEYLGRGVVAIHQPGDSVFVSWRVLGTDPDDMAFNLYRKTGSAAPLKLNKAPITGATIFSDAKVDFTQSNAYYVKPVLKGKEQQQSEAFTLAANAPVQPYLSVSLQTPAGYTPNDISVADLDGDGEYEIILHQTGRAHDNS